MCQKRPNKVILRVLTNGVAGSILRVEERETMDYGEIRRMLNGAGRLVDGGKVAEADALIRTLLGKGLTGRDMDVNLTDAQHKALRKFERSQRRASR